jgi:hypothetical protein
MDLVTLGLIVVIVLLAAIVVALARGRDVDVGWRDLRFKTTPGTKDADQSPVLEATLDSMTASMTEIEELWKPPTLSSYTHQTNADKHSFDAASQAYRLADAQAKESVLAWKAT